MADTTILNQTEQIPVMMKEDLDVLVDQIKQYVQSEKQIFQFASKDTFPQTGKVNLYYIDKTNLKVYIWSTESSKYVRFVPQDLVTTEDYLLLNCGGANDTFGF